MGLRRKNGRRRKDGEMPAGYARKRHNVRMRMELGGIKGQEQESPVQIALCSIPLGENDKERIGTDDYDKWLGKR